MNRQELREEIAKIIYYEPDNTLSDCTILANKILALIPEPANTEEIIKILDQDIYHSDDGSEGYNGNPEKLALGEILSGENINRIAQALSGRIGKPSEERIDTPYGKLPVIQIKKPAKPSEEKCKCEGFHTALTVSTADNRLLCNKCGKIVITKQESKPTQQRIEPLDLELPYSDFHTDRTIIANEILKLKNKINELINNQQEREE